MNTTVSIIIGVLIVLEGLYAVITGKMIGNNSRKNEKYTQASIAKYNRIVGVILLIIGALLIVNDVLSDDQFGYKMILLGVCLVGVICILVIGKIVLVKNDSPKANGKTEKYIDED